MAFRVYIGKTGGIARDELFAICSQFGQMVDFMLKDKYAFAEYGTDLDARKAVIGLDGRYIDGHRIIAEPAKSKGTVDAEAQQSTRVYVGRLNSSITREILMSCFARYGEVQDIMRKDDYAFIEFNESNAAIQSIKELNGLFLLGSKIVVEGARPKEEVKEVRSTRLYLGKITPAMKKQDLVLAFGCFGDIVDILLKEDYGFIEFTSTSAAQRALNAMNGARIAGTRINVEEAKSKEMGPLGGNVRRNMNLMGGLAGGVNAAMVGNMSIGSNSSNSGNNTPLQFLFPSFMPYPQGMVPYNVLQPSNRQNSSPRKSVNRSRSRSLEKKSVKNNEKA